MAVANESCIKPIIDGVDRKDITCAQPEIDRDGKLTKTMTQYSIFKKDEKYGITNQEGEVIVPAIYQEFGSLYFIEGRLSAKRNNKWGYMDTKGNEVVAQAIAKHSDNIDIHIDDHPELKKDQSLF